MTAKLVVLLTKSEVTKGMIDLLGLFQVSKVFFTDHCRRKNILTSLLRFVNRLYTGIQKT